MSWLRPSVKIAGNSVTDTSCCGKHHRIPREMKHAGSGDESKRTWTVIKFIRVYCKSTDELRQERSAWKMKMLVWRACATQCRRRITWPVSHARVPLRNRHLTRLRWGNATAMRQRGCRSSTAVNFMKRGLFSGPRRGPKWWLRPATES